jgi:hypothetical protein
MGFHIKVGWVEQFITAGHCSYQSGNTWHHYDAGAIGGVSETAYEPPYSGFNNARDVMRVTFYAEANAGFKIYDHNGPRHVESVRLPIEGESVCAAYGQRNTEDCGIVGVGAQVIDSNGVLVKGLTTTSGLVSFAGDSGSPYYHRNCFGCNDVAALGVHKGIDQNLNPWFAKIENVLNAWDAVVITDPD